MITVDDLEYAWTDFESEPEMTVDGSGDPDTYHLTITHWGEEYATITHRTVGGEYPLDGDEANAKRERAEHIVKALRSLNK